MGRYRAMNASWVPEPDYPKPAGTTGVAATPLDDSAYVVWLYEGPDQDTLDHYRVDVYQGQSLIRSVQVLEPDTDVIVSGLVNGTTYGVDVTPHNPGGYGKTSGRETVTPAKPLVPAPTLLTCVPGDGLVTVTWDWDAKALPAGFTLDWFSYEATRLDTGAVVTEHVTPDPVTKYKATCALTNDFDWSVRLVAVASNSSGKEYVSDLSNAMTAHPEKPIAPYKPRLTGAQLATGNNGQIDVSFAPGIQNVTATRPRRWWHKLTANGRTGPADITAWQVRVTSAADSQQTTSFDIPNGTARSYTTAKVALGTWLVDVRAKNVVGWSEWSNQLAVTYKPTDTRPFTADKPFSTFETSKYFYAIFDPGNDPGKGWDTTWTCTLTPAGQALAYDVLLVGAGGGGKGQTATLGKGGDGGGGQLNSITALTPTGSTFTVFISIGGSTAIDPKNTSVTFSGVETLALAGKSASSGADATGYARTPVPTSWLDCTLAFGWLSPDSESVGGVAQPQKQGYPNGLGWGCAGAGTKNASPGKGVEGLVVIRWAK